MANCFNIYTGIICTLYLLTVLFILISIFFFPEIYLGLGNIPNLNKEDIFGSNSSLVSNFEKLKDGNLLPPGTIEATNNNNNMTDSNSNKLEMVWNDSNGNQVNKTEELNNFFKDNKSVNEDALSSNLGEVIDELNSNVSWVTDKIKNYLRQELNDTFKLLESIEEFDKTEGLLEDSSNDQN